MHAHTCRCQLGTEDTYRYTHYYTDTDWCMHFSTVHTDTGFSISACIHFQECIFRTNIHTWYTQIQWYILIHTIHSILLYPACNFAVPRAYRVHVLYVSCAYLYALYVSGTICLYFLLQKLLVVLYAHDTGNTYINTCTKYIQIHTRIHTRYMRIHTLQTRVSLYGMHIHFWTFYRAHICMNVHILYVSFGEFISARIRLYLHVSACICMYAGICSNCLTVPNLVCNTLYVLYVSVCMICIVCIIAISMQYLHVLSVLAQTSTQAIPGSSNDPSVGQQHAGLTQGQPRAGDRPLYPSIMIGPGDPHHGPVFAHPRAQLASGGA